MAMSSAFRRILSGSSVSAPSILRWGLSSLRHNSTLTMPKLFVSDSRNSLIRRFPLFAFTSEKGNCLSRLTTDEKLKEAFSPFGQLLEAKVITDRVSGRSKGFGFVRYATIEEAEKAREGMNAKFLDGWVIFVDPAKPREPRPPPRPEPEPSETGFRTNKTIGWCG